MKMKTSYFRETMLMALGNVRAHKFRSVLTVLGIVIGVATVIAIASILTGLRGNLVKMIESYGTSNIFAFHLTTGIRMGPRDRAEWKRKPLTVEDGEAILAQASAVEDICYDGFIDWNFDRTITAGKNSYKRGNVEGVSASYGRITNQLLGEGRFIAEVDDQHRRDVMVIGPSVAEALFPHQARVLGNQVEMGGKPYEIIGVLEKKKAGFMSGEDDSDNAVFIPYRTLKKMSPRSEFMLLIIKAKEGQLKTALGQVEEILRRQRGLKFNDANNFDLNTADRFIEQFDGMMGGVGLIAIAISGVSLLVGGIGVMNIMLVSVKERTAEIGIRKALGARRVDITRQFLYEAITLTLLGGVMGVLLAIFASQILLLLIPDLPSSVPMWAVLAGLLVSIFVGVVFGVWPARQASRLDPIEALRYE
jgi:putative ABC transport system permease protein